MNLQEEKEVISKILTESKIRNKIVGDEIQIGKGVITFFFLFMRMIVPLLLLAMTFAAMDHKEVPPIFPLSLYSLWLIAGIVDWSRRSAANQNRKVIRPGSIIIYEKRIPATYTTADILKIHVEVEEHVHTMTEGSVHLVLKNGQSILFLRLESLVGIEMQEILLDMKACLQTYLVLPSTLETKVLIKYKEKILQASKN
jgi:hypothetical protein